MEADVAFGIVKSAAGGVLGGGGGGEGGGKGVSLRLRTAAHIFTETEMTAFYELMERCAYRPPDEAVEALAAELGLTAAVARTFVRKELAELAKMAQTQSAHAAMDRGRAAAAAAAADDDGVEGGAGDERSLPRAPLPRLTAEELRSALGVRCCEGSPLFPECAADARLGRCARMLPVCAAQRRGGPAERSRVGRPLAWGDLCLLTH